MKFNRLLKANVILIATSVFTSTSCTTNADTTAASTQKITQLSITNKTPAEKLKTKESYHSSLEVPPSEHLSSQPNSNQVLHTFNLSNANLEAMTDEVAQITGKNFMVSPEAQKETSTVTLYSHGKMTANEVYQVYLSALQVLKYGAVPAGNVIKIVKSDDANESAPPIASHHYPGKGDEIIIRVIPLNNISVTQMPQALKGLTPDSTVVNPYNDSNSLILAGYARNVTRLTEIIRDLDDQAAHQIDIVPLFNASADQIVKTLSALTDTGNAYGAQKQLKLAADAQNNNVLIMGNANVRKRYKNLIQRLDTARNTGAGGTEVIHLNYLQAEKLAPVLAKIAQGSMDQLNNNANNNVTGVQPISVSSNASSPDVSSSNKGGDETPENDSTMVQAVKAANAIVISAPATIMVSLNAVIKQLDTPPKQVLVEAVIARVDQALMNDLGVVWGTSNAETETVDSSGQPVTQTTFKEGIGYIPHGKIRAVIHALEQDTSNDILATPTIVVLDNNDALISDGKNVGIQDQQYAATAPGADTGSSSIPFTTFNRQDVTLELKVTPQISPDKKVRLKIVEQDDTLADPDSTNTNPQINTSKITTSVLADSQSIIVLGGLISHDQENKISKIPILSDFPILGQLFKHRSKSADRKDLMVFIRPVILEDKRMRTEVTKKRYDYMRDTELNKNAGLDMLTNEPGPILPEHYYEKSKVIPQPFTKDLYTNYYLKQSLPTPFEK